MKEWDENKHKRKPKGSPEGGRFAKTSDGAGGEHIPTQAEKERLREIGIDDKPQLSRQEYAVLRAEVMRKNVAQRGKVKPTNYAFTTNYFYVYSTMGDDGFVPLAQLDIEEDEEMIDFVIKILEK